LHTFHANGSLHLGGCVSGLRILYSSSWILHPSLSLDLS